MDEFSMNYCKNSDTPKIAVNILNLNSLFVSYSNVSKRMANSADPDQTSVAVWSVSTLFAQTSLSENLGSLR